MKRHGGNVNACYYVEEADFKRPHPAWLQPYDILIKGQTVETVKRSVFAGIREEGGREGRAGRSVGFGAPELLDRTAWWWTHVLRVRQNPKNTRHKDWTLSNGLWLIAMYPHSLINYHECATMWDNRTKTCAGSKKMSGYVDIFKAWLAGIMQRLSTITFLRLGKVSRIVES